MFQQSSEFKDKVCPYKEEFYSANPRPGGFQDLLLLGLELANLLKEFGHHRKKDSDIAKACYLKDRLFFSCRLLSQYIS